MSEFAGKFQFHIDKRLKRESEIYLDFYKPHFLIIFRERENHSAHLASIEAELDSQVAKVD